MRSPPRKEADGGCIFPRIVVCVSLQQTSSITNGAGAEMFEQILSRISYKSSPRYFWNDTWLVDIRWELTNISKKWKFDCEFGCNVSFYLNLVVNDVSLIGLVHSTICCVCLCHITSRYILIPHGNQQTKPCPNLVKGKIAISKQYLRLLKSDRTVMVKTQGEK